MKDYEGHVCRYCGGTDDLELCRLDKWSGNFLLCAKCRKEFEKDLCRRIAYRYREERKDDSDLRNGEST